MNNAIGLKEILQKTLKQESWQLNLLADWPLIVGNLAHRVRVEKIEGSTLVLGVQHASWMHELYLLSNVLLKTINNHFDRPRIQKLVFKTATFKKKEATPKHIAPAPTPVEPVELTFTQKEALAAIKDTELRQSLRTFFYRCAHQKNV